MEDLASCIEFANLKAKCKMKLWGGYTGMFHFIKVRCFLSGGDGDVLLISMPVETLYDEIIIASL